MRNMILFFVLLCMCLYVHGAFPPIDRISYLAERSELILEGEALGKGSTVKVVHVLKKSEHFLATQESLVVEGLDRYERFLWKDRKQAANQPPIETRKVILFLNYDPNSRKWIVHPVGIVWFDSDRCYRYRQETTTGPYHLFRDSELATVREQIDSGLRSSKLWQTVLDIKEPQEKAAALAKYLYTPVNSKFPSRFPARTELVKLKLAAVPAVIDILKNPPPNENLDEVVLTVYELGHLAQEAAPLLAKLLENPGTTDVSHILSTLKVLNDSRSTKAVRPLIKDASVEVRANAAVTLAALGDKDSAKAIAEALPRDWTKENEQSILSILNAMWHLNPELAEPLIKKAEADPNLADIKDHLRRWDHKLPPKPPKEEF